LISKDALWWFFSADAQVFGALIGISGFFTIYVFQSIDQSISISADEVARIMKRLVQKDYFVYGIKVRLEKIRDEIKHQRNESAQDPAVDEVENILKTIDKLIIRKKNVSNSFSRLTILSLGVLLISISSLPFSEQLTHYPWIAYPLFFMSLTGSIVSIVLLGLFMRMALGIDVSVSPFTANDK